MRYNEKGELVDHSVLSKEQIDKIEAIDGMIVTMRDTFAGPRQRITCDLCGDDSPIWSPEQFADGNLAKLEQHVQSEGHKEKKW